MRTPTGAIAKPSGRRGTAPRLPFHLRWLVFCCLMGFVVRLSACRSPEGPVGPTGPPEAAGKTAPSPAPSPAVAVVETTPSGIEVDRQKAEVRFPCRFVNPTRVLEVFACHATGPTHETVLEFHATGPEIYRALRAIGLRGARYWNGTSPVDSLKNQGDRVLILVRWEFQGVTRELPAEGMLLDGRTGFPTWVRGFSVSTRAVMSEETEEPAGIAPQSAPAEEAKGAPPRGEGAAAAPAPMTEPQIPEGVEISLGATNRQSPSFSLLSHPTNLPLLRRWMLPPELNEDVVKDHEKLVEERVPATLIIRRIRSEVDLVKYAQSMARERGLSDRLPVYERALTLAVEIDKLKREYEDLLSGIRELIGEEADVAKLPEVERASRAKRGLEFIRRGRWLCARIEELYFTWYAAEEEFKATWVEKRTDLPEDVREETLVLVRDGMVFEPLLAAKRTEFAAVDLPGSGQPAGERNLRRAIIDKEIEILEIQRQGRLSRDNLRYTESRLAAVDPSDNYVRRLFEEDEMRFEIAIRADAAKEKLAGTELTELKALFSGGWESIKAQVLSEREKAQVRIRLTELEYEVLSALEEIRWRENDLQSGVPDREEKAKADLDESLRKKKELEAKIEEMKRQLGS